MRMSKYWLFSLIFILLSWISACGGTQKGVTLDIKSLITNGECASVISKLSSRDISEQERGALALCRLSESANSQSAVNDAMATLTDALTPAARVKSASAMIDFSKVLTGKTADFNMTLLYCALGSVGYGRYKHALPLETESEAVKELAIDLMEHLNYTISIKESSDYSQTSLDKTGLVEIWNGIYSLLGGQVKFVSPKSAWRFFTNLSNIALAVFNPLKHGEFEYLLMKTAIYTAEMNPQIAVAVRCDLASPYDKLKRTVSSKQELSGSLARAVSSATGCKMGKYAP